MLRIADAAGEDRFAGVLRLADFRVEVFFAGDLRAGDLRADDWRVEDFRAEDLRAEDLRAEDLRADDLRADDLRADVLRDADLRADVFRPVDFFPADFFRVDFFAVPPRRVLFFIADFFRVAFAALFLPREDLPVPLRPRADLPAAFLPPFFRAAIGISSIENHFPATVRSPRSAESRPLNRDAIPLSGSAAAASALSCRLAGTYNR
jgi:hypothetical protein